MDDLPEEAEMSTTHVYITRDKPFAGIPLRSNVLELNLFSGPSVKTLSKAPPGLAAWQLGVGAWQLYLYGLVPPDYGREVR